MGTSINIKDNTITNESGQVSISNTITNQFSIQSLAKNYPVSIPYYKGLPDPVKKFSGREDEIKQIHEHLKNKVLNQTATISGLGGVGKTETAKAYAKLYKDEFKIILYIVAENRLILSDTICKFASDFHVDVEYVIRDENEETRKKSRPIRDVVEELYNRCVSYGNTLIILDNVDEQSDIIDYLPSESLGDNKPKMLITSRRRDWELNDYGSIHTIPLGVFDLETATDFIKKCLDVNLYNESDIEELCVLLQYLPLALKQAVGFIFMQNRDLKLTGKRYTIANYIQEYNTRTFELLDYEVDKSMYIYTVANTWGITKKKLEENYGKVGKNAVEILELISYLLPDIISATDIFHIDNNEMNRKAINLLEEYSMIDCQTEIYSEKAFYKNSDDRNDNDSFDDGDINSNDDEEDDASEVEDFVKNFTKINIHRLVQEITTIEVKRNKKEEKVTENLLMLLNSSGYFEGLIRQSCAVWNVACNYPNILDNHYFKMCFNPLYILAADKGTNLNTLKILCKYEYRNGKFNNILFALERSVLSNDMERFKYLFHFIKSKRLEIDFEKVIHHQLMNSDTDFAVYLLENSVGIDHKFSYDLSPLMMACKKRNERLVKLLCDKKCDINQKSDSGKTAFMYACEYGNVKIIKYLLNTGKVNVNEQDLEDWTGFMYACRIKRSEIAVYLINTIKIKLNMKNSDGVTAFMLACDYGNLNMVKILINTGKVDLNLQDNNGMSPLLYACQGGHYDIVKILLETKQIELSVQDKKGTTAIMYAFTSKNIKLIEYLLYKCEMDLNIRDNRGISVLMYACNHSNLEIVKYLIEVVGIDTNVRSNDGVSIVIPACISKKLDIIKYLVETVKVDLESVDNNGKSVLMYACIYSTLEIIKYLIDTDKIDLKTRDINGMSAFMYACSYNDTDVVEYLIDTCKMDLNDKDKNGRSIFMHACLELNQDIVQYLIHLNGFELKGTDKEGRTTLHLMCLSDKLNYSDPILDILISQGFDIYQKDNYGKTPLDYCNEMECTDTAKYLVEIAMAKRKISKSKKNK